jgi:hypothetical protein
MGFLYSRELLKRVTGWECELAVKGYVQLGVWIEVLFRTPHKKLILSAHDTPQSHHQSYPTLSGSLYHKQHLRRLLNSLNMLILFY